MADPRQMTDAQRAYETRRAAKAGMSLERWLDLKEKERAAEAKTREKASQPPPPPRKPGLISRLIDRASKPLS